MRKQEIFMAPAMPCIRIAQTSTTKVVAKQEFAPHKVPKTSYGCIVESHEATRQRVESSPPTKHEDRIAGKWDNSMTHDNLLHKFIPMLQAMKIPDEKAAVDKEWKKLETIPAWSRARRRLFSKHKEIKRKSIGAKISKTKKSQSRAPWWHCNRRLWSLRSFYWTGRVCVPNDCRISDECYCKIARLWRTSNCRGICLYPGKVGGRSKIAQNSKVRVSRYMDPSSTTQMAKSWVNIEDPVVSLERKFFGHPSAGLLWERQIEEVPLELGWEKVPNWECVFVHRKQRFFLLVHVDDMKMAGKKQHITPMRKKLMIYVDLDERTSFLDHMYLGCTQRECTPNESIIDEYREMFESQNSAGATEKLPGWEKPFTQRRWHGPTTWKDMLENALSDIANSRTKRQSSFSKFQIFVGKTTNWNRKNLNQWENCHKYARKLSQNACTWHELGDQTFYGLSTNLQEQSHNGLRHAVDDWQDWCQIFTTQVTIDNIVMWVTRLSIVDGLHLKTQTLLEILKT